MREDVGGWRVRTGWSPWLGAFERVSRERMAVRPAVVLLCASTSAGAGWRKTDGVNPACAKMEA